jgi:hypothetical protein
MRIVEPPSLASLGRGRHEDDLDRLLSDFFRSGLPNPWPKPPDACDLAETLPLTARQPVRGRPALRSRFALAASVALLLAGGSFLAGKFEAVPGSGSFDSLRDEADSKFDRPSRPLREGDVQPRTRERIILDKNGQTGFQVELDLP